MSRPVPAHERHADKSGEEMRFHEPGPFGSHRLPLLVV